MYYNRKGERITLDQYIALAKSTTPEHQWNRVAETTLDDGTWISTVFLGLDHRFGSGPPLLFETMVFPKQGHWEEQDCARYTTEAQARRGHVAMVRKWRRRGAAKARPATA